MNKFKGFLTVLLLVFVCSNAMAQHCGNDVDGLFIGAKVRVLNMTLANISYLTNPGPDALRKAVIDLDIEIVNLNVGSEPTASSPSPEYQQLIKYFQDNAKQMSVQVAVAQDQVKELTKLALAGNYQGKLMMDATLVCVNVHPEMLKSSGACPGSYFEVKLIDYRNLTIFQSDNK